MNQQLEAPGYEGCAGAVAAAESAGRHAARMVARRYSPWKLGSGGQVGVRVTPLDAPVARWLWRTGRGQVVEDRAVQVPVVLTSADLDGAPSPASNARALLVLQAYATAYANVLVYECGVVATVRIAPEPP